MKHALELTDTDGILKRMNESAARQTAEIRKHGARDWTELLMILEVDACPNCDGKAATCKIAEFVNNHGYWRRSRFCPKCFGRFAGTAPTYDKDGNRIGEQSIYRDSEFFTQVSGDGAGFVVTRCDCAAARTQYGQKMPEAAAIDSSLCAVKQRLLEEATRQSTVKRWRQEAADARRGYQPSQEQPANLSRENGV